MYSIVCAFYAYATNRFDIKIANSIENNIDIVICNLFKLSANSHVILILFCVLFFHFISFQMSTVLYVTSVSIKSIASFVKKFYEEKCTPNYLYIGIKCAHLWWTTTKMYHIIFRFQSSTVRFNVHSVVSTMRISFQLIPFSIRNVWIYELVSAVAKRLQHFHVVCASLHSFLLKCQRLVRSLPMS